MKIQVTFKDPDALHEAITDTLEGEDFGLDNEMEAQTIREMRKETLVSLCYRWFEYGEYLTVEIDTDKGTATVLEVDSE